MHGCVGHPDASPDVNNRPLTSGASVSEAQGFPGTAAGAASHPCGKMCGIQVSFPPSPQPPSRAAHRWAEKEDEDPGGVRSTTSLPEHLGHSWSGRLQSVGQQQRKDKQQTVLLFSSEIFLHLQGHGRMAFITPREEWPSCQRNSERSSLEVWRGDSV